MLWVRSVIQPTRNVLVNPPILPIELIKAMPAAAAAPARKFAGSVQNDACEVDTDAAAMVSPIIAISVLLVAKAVSARPAAASSVGIVVCQRRSRMRSALLLTSTIAIIAAI